MPLMWDRVVVINRDDRDDRMRSFARGAASSSMLSKAGVVRFSAYDETKLACPRWFGRELADPRRRVSMWCCRASHLAVWSQAIVDGVNNLLVFEDDAGITEEFDACTEAFFAEMPPDYYGYQLGGYNYKRNAVRPLSGNCGLMCGCWLLHAYGLSRDGLRAVYDGGHYRPTKYIDCAVGEVQEETKKFYCPRRWFVPQLAGYSDNYNGIASYQGVGDAW